MLRCDFTGEVAYQKETTGTCSSGYAFIETASECNAAARSLGLSDTTADGARGNTPHGCFFKASASTLYFNEDGDRSDTDTDRVSICRRGGTYTLIKTGVECEENFGEHNFGKQSSLESCAQKCETRAGCTYFIYGTGPKEGNCWQEGVTSDDCGPKGYESDSYDLYKITKGKPD